VPLTLKLCLGEIVVDLQATPFLSSNYFIKGIYFYHYSYEILLYPSGNGRKTLAFSPVKRDLIIFTG
jgi:hypothetical protein